jgi:transcriptional regulator with XRE-family HTH domain
MRSAEKIPDPEWVRIGATLRTLRELRGEKPDPFASAIGISRPYLANIEAGRKKLTNVLLARALGEAPEMDESLRPLYVWDYLKSKGLHADMVDAKASGFGQRVKKLYVEKYDREPDRHFGEVKGRVRPINAYTEADRPLFDKVWAREYATKISDAAFTVIDGGAS